MPRHKTTWIVMADGTRALIVTRRDVPEGFDVVADLSSEVAHVPAHLIASERPGRTQESHSPARHAIEPRHDPHEERLAAFVGSVAAYLNEQSAAKAFDHLILFAPPRALGQIRDMLDDSAKAKVSAQAAKDLTKMPLEDLPKHLAALP
ncbi:MAG TPA: host attachment protein [Stellaceae bacterium]|nr:host attachment protein [Stellaceae bacterium]